MPEFELKFGVPPPVLASLRDALLAHGAQPLHLQAHYFDTADGLLARKRLALRLRREGERWVQTLKAEGAGVAERLEDEVEVAAGDPRQAVPVLDAARHDGSAAGRALAAALDGVTAPQWVERHATDVLRLVCLLHLDDGSAVEVALDTGSVDAGGASVALCELELEHKAGPLAGLFALAAAWVAHGGLWLSATTKAERGEWLLRGGEPKAVKARAPRIDRHAGAPQLLRAVLRSALAQVLANGGSVAEGIAGAEHVHQLRVGLRRLRTALRELAPLSTAIDPGWEIALGHAFAQLGQRRDAEAVAASVRPLLLAADAPRLAWQPPPAPEPQQVARGRELQVALVAILALAHAGDGSFVDADAAATRALLARRLDVLRRQVVRDGRRFEELPIERQHRVRKRLKRLRYLAEFAQPLWPDAKAKKTFAGLSRAQDALGLHNDVAVAAQAFRHDAAAHPAAWFAAGWLAAHLALTARAARKALAPVGDAKPFWHD